MVVVPSNSTSIQTGGQLSPFGVARDWVTMLLRGSMNQTTWDGLRPGLLSVSPPSLFHQSDASLAQLEWLPATLLGKLGRHCNSEGILRLLR